MVRVFVSLREKSTFTSIQKEPKVEMRFVGLSQIMG